MRNTYEVIFMVVCERCTKLWKEPVTKKKIPDFLRITLMVGQSPQVLDFIIDLKPNKIAFRLSGTMTTYCWNGLMKAKTICCGTIMEEKDGFGLRIC
jgi:hypothetical protein